MGVLTFFIYLLLKNHYFWNIGDSQIETPFWTISHKIERNVLPITHLFNLYTWELNFGQTIWDKSEVLFGNIWGTTWELMELFQNLMGTHKEHYENNTKAKKYLLHSFPNEKNWIPHELMMSFHWLCGTFIYIIVCHHFWPGLMT
jgi:hypothetical protein